MARLFNGTTDTIDCGASVNSPAAITISGWVNGAAFGLSHNLPVGRLDATNLYFFFINGPGSGTPTGTIAWAVNASGGTPLINPGSNTLSAATWYHLLMTYSSSAGLVGYVNGVSDGTAAANGTMNAVTGHFGIGWDAFDNSDFWQGAIADVAQWNTILSPTQISALAAGRRANNVGANANLDGYWPLQGLSSPEPDLSGNGHPGILNGTSFTPDPPQLDPLTPPLFAAGGTFELEF